MVGLGSDSRLPGGGHDRTVRLDGLGAVDHRPLLPGRDGKQARGRPRKDDRQVLNGIFFILRTGASWRDLPERYGPYTTAYNRFNRWTKRGVWAAVFRALTQRSPDSLRMIDSTVVRAHQHAAAPKKTAKKRSGARVAD
jgi:transposase